MSSFLVVAYELMVRLEICTSFKNLYCDLKFSHCNFIHSYPGYDLDSLLRQENFQVFLNNSIPSKFDSPNLIKTSIIQFIFIIQIFNESIQLCIRFKIEAQNKIKNSPKLSIMLYRKQNSINQRRVYCPFLSLVQIGSLNVEIPLYVHSYYLTRNIHNLEQQ